jgi:predicted ATP-dependent endonuclease of OLD family
MYLSKTHYYEHKERDNYWEMKDINFGKFNLIVGQNATGKTRLMNVISNFAKIITKRLKIDGNFEFEFSNSETNQIIYKYILHIENKVVRHEELRSSERQLLRRDIGNGVIYSETERRLIPFNPPDDEITLNVRRDKKEYPFLEELINWAENFHGYSFSGISANILSVLRDPKELLERLENIPYLLDEAISNSYLTSQIIQDFNSVGYLVESIGIQKFDVENIKMALIKERDLNCPTIQNSMSQGMYRALAIIVILESLLAKRKQGTIAIDDLGEGLDYERSSKLMQLIEEKTEDSQLQLIITSNDRFLINKVNLKSINFLKRNGHIVSAFNYNNSKEIFEEFLLTGLNNFDFLSGGILKKLN